MPSATTSALWKQCTSRWGHLAELQEFPAERKFQEADFERSGFDAFRDEQIKRGTEPLTLPGLGPAKRRKRGKSA